MREKGTFQVLKRKLSLQPLFTKEKNGSGGRLSPEEEQNRNSNPPSSPLAVVRPGSIQHSVTSTASWDSQGPKYHTLKLSETITVSIGDSFDTNPSSKVENIPKFEYGPIRYPKTTRLLLILPAVEDDEPLETIMFHADLNEIPYQALSYACNMRTPTEMMHCNGRCLTVPESLYKAMRHLRNMGDRKAYSVVWADAISFNQADPLEREARLRLIKDVFTCAYATIANFGGTEKQRQKVFETVDMLHEACKCDDFRERLDQNQIELSSLDHLSIGNRRLRISSEHRAELSTFFCHPWLERIWSWLEVGHSKKVFIMYGGALRSWAFFADAAWCMHQLHWETSVNAECFVHGQTRMDLKHCYLLHLDDHRQDVLEGKSFTLLSLLTISRRFVSEKPLDRVFALWSHIESDGEREIVQAFFDYSLSPLNVFLNLALNSIISLATLDVLHLVHTDARGNWPSFVPDVSIKDGVRTLGSKDGPAKWEYHAARDTKPQLTVYNTEHSTRYGIPYFEDDVKISLKGVMVDKVSRVGAEMKDMMPGSTSFLADWINTSIMTRDKKFYTWSELKRAKEALDMSRKMRQGRDLGPYESSESWGSGSAERAASRTHLRNSFTPSLVEAIKSLEFEFDEAVPIDEKWQEPDPTSNLPFDEPYLMGGISVVEAFWRTLIKNKDEDGKTPSADMGASHFQPWFKAISGSISHMLEALAPGHSTAGARPEPLFNYLVHVSCNGSRMIRTEKGLIGTAPLGVQEGDLVCVLHGGQTPFVLREDESQPGWYRFVGDCYMHGIMEGEALEMGLEEQEFIMT